MASMKLTTRLENAARVGDCEVIKEEINRDTCTVNSTDSDDWTALLWAAYKIYGSAPICNSGLLRIRRP